MEIRHRINLNLLLPPNPVTAEVGVAEAYFSEHILKHWNPSHHYLIDNWGTLATFGDGAFDQDWHNKNYDAAMKRMLPFEDKITVLRGLSWRMAQKIKDNSLDLVYLDAGHSLEDVRKDLEAFYPKVKAGGIVAGHDFVNLDYGVFQAVGEFTLMRNIIPKLIPENKDEDAGFYFIKYA
jgi:Methyltransferase domain